jgi:hypothetical protein
MDTTTLLIIVLLVLLFAGGGWYGRGRWYLTWLISSWQGGWSILLYCDELIN